MKKSALDKVVMSNVHKNDSKRSERMKYFAFIGHNLQPTKL